MVRIFKCDRLDRRRAAIIEAARTLLIEQGYEGMTLGGVVERAGGSLATIYKLFGNKDGLLDAVVFENASSGETLIAEAEGLGLSPPDVVHYIAQKLHQQFLDPDVIAIVRIVIARSIVDAESAARFFSMTAIRTQDSLEGLFESWCQEGMVLNDDPALLAEMFFGLIISDLHGEAIGHGTARNLSPDHLMKRTDLFLRAAGIER